MNNSDDSTNQSPFQHQQVLVEGVSLHVVTAGQADKPAIFFLHGYPQNWLAFKSVMNGLQDNYYAVAIDLPGIGQSEPIESNDKQTIARYINGAINALGLKQVTLVGRDVGGMITYAYLHAYPNELEKAVIMNVAIPSLDPWTQIKQNPQIWHFAFNAIPDLPETLVTGKQRAFFDYFFNTIAAQPDKIDEQARNAYAQAYESYNALHTGFEWYRTFPQDENDNEATKGRTIQTPVLYIRGEREYGKIDAYLTSFRASGLINIEGQLVPGSGHYAPDEAPEEVVRVLKAFIQ